MTPFEITEHPADIKLLVHGLSREELFANAARGMMTVLYGNEILECEPDDKEEITVGATDIEHLFVDWLSELLYLSNTHYRAYIDVDVKELTKSSVTALVGSCSGEAIDDIKAVTYHQLKVTEKDGAWEATVVFDI